MTMYYVVSNGLHTTVVTGDEVFSKCEGDADDALKQAAVALAVERFTEHQVDPVGLKVVAAVDPEDEPEGFTNWYGDDPEDIGLTDGAFLRAAQEVAMSDEFEVDDNAVVSGYNVQGWHWVDPEEVLTHLSTEAPVACARPQAALSSDSQESVAALRHRAAALLDALAADVLTDVPELGEAVIAVRSHMAALREIVGETPKQAPAVVSDVIQTWEVGEGSAGGFTEEQRKPWRREVTVVGNQMRIDLWPAALSRFEAEEGLNLLIEVNAGRPCVHIGPGVNGDNACHVHVLSPSKLEVAPACGHIELGETEVYAGPDGPVRGHPVSAYFRNQE